MVYKPTPTSVHWSTAHMHCGTGNLCLNKIYRDKKPQPVSLSFPEAGILDMCLACFSLYLALFTFFNNFKSVLGEFIHVYNIF